jgi:hypothetical protein
MQNKKYNGLIIASSLLASLSLNHSIALAADIETQDIILSSNGAAGSEDWEYNAAQGEGWVRYILRQQPKGRIRKVRGRCVDNCVDARKFQYKIKLENRKVVLYIKATNREQGLIRVEVTAVVD